VLGLAATSGLTNLDTHWITRPLKDEKLESWWRVEAGEMATLKSWENSKARTEANHVLTCDSVVSQKLNVALIVSCTFFQQAICCAPFSLGSAGGSPLFLPPITRCSSFLLLSALQLDLFTSTGVISRSKWEIVSRRGIADLIGYKS